MVNEPQFVRCDTLFQALHQHYHTPIRIITVKQKLLSMLQRGMPADNDSVLAVSVETVQRGASHADRTVLELMRRYGLSERLPGIYDPDISISALQIACVLLQHDIEQRSGMPPHQADASPYPLYYISTTDYVQHNYAPTAPQAIEFYNKFDTELRRLHSYNINLGVTADHGVSSVCTCLLGSVPYGANLCGCVLCRYER